MNRLILLIGVFAAGCTHVDKLQYDHGRCYEDILAIQADRSRPSAIGTAYVLGGAEAILIRNQSEAAATDEESTTADSTATISVD